MSLRDRCDLRFLPDSSLKVLICERAVLEALEKHKSGLLADVSDLVKFVCTRAQRLFAILAWSDAESLIDQFYEQMFDDDSLPVKVVVDYNEGLVKASTWREGKLSMIKDPPFHHFFENPWTERTIDHFCDDDQWLFLSPVFEQHKFRYSFHDRCRMPFVEDEPRSQKESYFSVVEEWSIHRGHLRTVST